MPPLPDALRHEFANLANPFYDSLQAIRSALHSTANDLAEQLALFTAKTEVRRIIRRDDDDEEEEEGELTCCVRVVLA
jgi:hypothetical protein